MTCNVTVHRARIHAGAAANTTKHWFKIATKDVGATIIDHNDVDILGAISFVFATTASVYRK